MREKSNSSRVFIGGRLIGLSELEVVVDWGVGGPPALSITTTNRRIEYFEVVPSIAASATNKRHIDCSVLLKGNAEAKLQGHGIFMKRKFSILIATVVVSFLAVRSFALSTLSGAGSSASLSGHDSTSSPEATPSVDSSNPTGKLGKTGSTGKRLGTSSPPSTNPSATMGTPNPSPGSVNRPSGVPGADAP